MKIEDIVPEEDVEGLKKEIKALKAEIEILKSNHGSGLEFHGAVKVRQHKPGRGPGGIAVGVPVELAREVGMVDVKKVAVYVDKEKKRIVYEVVG